MTVPSTNSNFINFNRDTTRFIPGNTFKDHRHLVHNKHYILPDESTVGSWARIATEVQDPASPFLRKDGANVTVIQCCVNKVSARPQSQGDFNPSCNRSSHDKQMGASSEDSAARISPTANPQRKTKPIKVSYGTVCLTG
jgi:hypothetical protein